MRKKIVIGSVVVVLLGIWGCGSLLARSGVRFCVYDRSYFVGSADGYADRDRATVNGCRITAFVRPERERDPMPGFPFLEFHEDLSRFRFYFFVTVDRAGAPQRARIDSVRLAGPGVSLEPPLRTGDADPHSEEPEWVPLRVADAHDFPDEVSASWHAPRPIALPRSLEALRVEVELRLDQGGRIQERRAELKFKRINETDAGLSMP